MTAAVFDAAAIAARRRHLFGVPEPQSVECVDRERYGTSIVHCAMCPKTPEEACTLNCTQARHDLQDGVTVT